ncbi:MAG: ABC transporter substrate-binding protein, partial [Bacteroidia bacterium]|nr:ABC transporter substrate-binding protein [Bacteroidia bacterium]MDW8133975.1 ABC transporter substrate-binding protein [Bacteroidia bacterium]
MGIPACQPSPPKEDILRIALFAPYTSIDPIYARDQVSVWLVQQVFAGLVKYDEKMQICPDLAERWEISADGLRYRFFLRKGVSFHGYPNRTLRARDVVYSWHRLAHPRWGSPGSYLFRGLIRGWTTYQEGKADSITGIRSLGDSIVEVDLEAPYAPFLHLLTLPYAMIVLPEVAESLGRRFGQSPVGCGPFKVIFQETGRMIALARWKRASPPFVQKIVFRWFPNRLWAWEALKRGEIDAFEGTERALEYILRRDSEWREYAQRIEEPQIGTEYLGINVSPESPLSSVKLRKALHYFIHRLPIVEVVMHGHATLAQSFLPPPLLAWLPKQDTTPPSAQTLEQLKQTPLTLYAAPSFRELVEFIQSQLTLQGIKIKTEYLLGASLREYLNKGKIYFWKGSWLADFPEGENFLILFESSQQVPKGPNTTRYASPQMDSLIHLSRRTYVESIRKIIYSQAESLLQESVPVIPLYHAHGIWTLSKRVKDFPRSKLPVWLPLEKVRL